MTHLTFFVVAVCALAPFLQSQAPPSVEKELRELRLRMDDDVLKKNRASMEQTLADDYFCIHSNGKTSTKTDQIEALMSSTATSINQNIDELKFRVYGDIAIVTGLSTSQGETTAGARRFTDIFAKRDGRWQMVGCQATLVAPIR